MQNLADLQRYDDFWPRLPRRYRTRKTRWGAWKRATVIAPWRGPLPFDDETSKVEDREVVVLGAGPSGLLIAAYLAHAGHQVVVIERQPTLFSGSTWNLAQDEFDELKLTPPLSVQEWESMITGRFREGYFRLHDESGPKPCERDFDFEGCLNVSIDAKLFFKLLGAAPGVEFRMGATAELEALCTDASRCQAPAGAYVRWDREDNSFGIIRAKLLIDARGWRSALGYAVHPHRKVESVYNMLGIMTKGDVPWPQREQKDASGNSLKDSRGNPRGIICATYQDGIRLEGMLAQGIVERFTDFVEGSPEYDGRRDVLYYFTRTPQPARLTEMLKSMNAALAKVAPDVSPADYETVLFGHAPGYYEPGPFDRWALQTSAGDRLLLLGVAAQQYSGLTGCAFGALARNARSIGAAIHEALAAGDLSFRRLSSIDIDPRERNSQAIAETFGGTMAVNGNETLHTPNRDWLIFCEAAGKAHLTPKMMGEALKDKIVFETLNRMIGMLRVDPRVGEVMLRNNENSEIEFVWTAGRGYLWLMLEEARRLVRTRNPKYWVGIRKAITNLPGLVVDGSAVALHYMRTRRDD